MTRLFFCTDLHGSEICFRKFLHAGDAYEAGVVIMGGDCTGKMIIPVVGSDEDSVADRPNPGGPDAHHNHSARLVPRTP